MGVYIDFESVIELFVCNIQKALLLKLDANVVTKNIQAPEGFNCMLYNGDTLLFISQVSWH
ncbi:hypothetical protein AWM70_16230 [Paenibacillus yonginensis]|uniref:Uncharacterized protein n=1 Tax=Paenibacillus yonginensis TaxID=1462996 RepID=A0A1B1N3C5_9BACL|nr:hypothetical protein AWM70_16230 [Paenibacillus yonginensis]